jgi:hypothetical protein
MPRRPAAVTQADIARAIRALRDAGAPVERLRVRLESGSVIVEVGEDEQPATLRNIFTGERKIVAL